MKSDSYMYAAIYDLFIPLNINIFEHNANALYKHY